MRAAERVSKTEVTGCLFVALVLAGCGGGPPGLARDAAIEAARAAAPGGDTITSVISATPGRFDDFDEGSTEAISPPDRRVWAVAFRGAFAGSCGRAPLTPEAHAQCPPPATTILVIIDRNDGTFIEATSPADARE